MSGHIRKIIKLCLAVVGISSLLIVAMVGVFIATFDANQYKQELSDLVREKTGRNLQFYSDVGLSFYPVLGIELGALSLSNTAGFGSEPIVSVNKVSMSVDVASIIALSPQIDELILDGLVINLQKNAQGIANWDDFSKPVSKQVPDAKTTSTKGEFSNEPMTLSGAFGGLNITNAQLSWVDSQAGNEYKIENLNIKTGRITPHAPFSLQVQLAVETNNKIKINLDLKTQVQYLLDKSLLNMSRLELNTVATGELLPLGKIHVSVNSQAARLNLVQRSVSFTGLVLVLDDNRLTGNVNLTPQTLGFKLAADKLDIDALLGTPSVQPLVSAEITNAKAQDLQINIPMPLLRSINIYGELAVKQLKVKKIFFNNINLGILANSGIVMFDPMITNIYGGRLSGSLRLDARSDLPIYKLNSSVQSVQIEQLLANLLGESRISGLLNADIAITSHGEWLSDLKKNSNGNIKLTLKDGALGGFNLRHTIDQAKAKVKGQNAPAAEARKTDFSSLELGGKINSGIFFSNDLNLQAPMMRMGGEGEINFNHNTVDYIVRAKVVDTIKGQGGVGAKDLLGMPIPVRVYGPIANPKIDVQLDKMLKSQAAKKLAEAKVKLQIKLAFQKAKIAKKKVQLKKQIDEKKAKLVEVKRLELEDQKKILQAKMKARLDAAKANMLNNLFN